MKNSNEKGKINMKKNDCISAGSGDAAVLDSLRRWG